MAQGRRTNPRKNHLQRNPDRFGPNRDHNALHPVLSLPLHSFSLAFQCLFSRSSCQQAVRYKTDVEVHLEKLLETGQGERGWKALGQVRRGTEEEGGRIQLVEGGGRT
ncbi:hypothetical protein CJ030_MR4G001521 [Morella rubra]|uniref:Uncharacterized protein n=1 Tax=Morella rubra TaxID=262757 RepID=A0A6A1VV93_9ROSI|nr:hypothetical protein CJ030_MR4G001521 [Morella rubra]